MGNKQAGGVAKMALGMVPGVGQIAQMLPFKEGGPIKDVRIGGQIITPTIKKAKAKPKKAVRKSKAKKK